MYKIIVSTALLFGFLNGSQEITNRVSKKNKKENVLQIVTHIAVIQNLIKEYLDVHDNLKSTLSSDPSKSYMAVIPKTNLVAELVFWSGIGSLIRIYTLENGNFVPEKVYQLPQEAESIVAHPNGKEIVFVTTESGSDPNLYTLDLQSVKISQLPIDDCNGILAISPNGYLIAGQSSWGHTNIWPWGYTEERPIRIKLEPEFTRATSLAFSSDEQKLAIGTHNGFSMGSIKLYDLETKEITNLPDSAMLNEVSSIAFSQDGKFLAACGSKLKNIKIWNYKTGKLIHTSKIDADNIVGFSADNKYLITSLQNSHFIWSNSAHELEYEESTSSDNANIK